MFFGHIVNCVVIFFFIFNKYWRGLGFGGPAQVHSFHMPKAVSLYISSRCFLRTVYLWQQFISAFLVSFVLIACYPPTSPFPCCMLITAHALTTTLTRSALYQLVTISCIPLLTKNRRNSLSWTCPKFAGFSSQG